MAAAMDEKLNEKQNSYHHGALRETLMDLGERALETGRWDGLSLRGLARSAGVSHAAPYRHFPDRESLRLALRDRELQKLCDHLEDLSRRHSANPLHILMEFGNMVAADCADRPHQMGLLFEDLQETPVSAVEKKRLFRLLLGPVVEHCHLSGRRHEIDPVAATASLWTVVIGTAALVKARWIPEREKLLAEAGKNLRFGLQRILKAAP